MSDPIDKPPEEAPVTGRQTIREVMGALRSAQQEDLRQEVLGERRRRREDKEKRVQERRERQLTQIRTTKARQQTVLKDVGGKVAKHVTVASRELQAALRDIGSVPLPRHSQEGREQVRIRHSIEGALSALRQVGRGSFYETDLDLDFDDIGS